MNNITQSLKVILLAVIFSLGISYAFAWVAPTVAPTGGNSAAPLNTSTGIQTKAGTLVFNRNDGVQGLETYGTTLLATDIGGLGLVGVGTPSPWAKLTIENTNSPSVIPDLAVGNVNFASSNIVFTNGLVSDEAMIATSGAGAGETNFVITTRGNDTGGASARRFIIGFDGNMAVGTTTTSSKLAVGGIIESLWGGVKFPDGTVQMTAVSGGRIMVKSITGLFSSAVPYTYTALPNTHPISLTVTISAYGGGSREGSADVRWLNDAGIVVRDWKKISGTNIGNGNDGGSGMRDMELATIPFLDGSTKIEFRGVGNGYNGELISYTYQN